MADYIREIGGNTRLMIRHYGGVNFDFFVQTGASTFNHSQDWECSAGGNTHHGVFDLQKGGGWQLMGGLHLEDLGANFDVRLSIYDEGIGFPTYDFIQHISLARVPDIPGAPYFGERGADFIHAAFDYGYDGGAAIDDAEIWYSFDGRRRFAVYHTRDQWIYGLSPRTRYFFHARVHNAYGWSDFSGPTATDTLGPPDPPRPPNVLAVNAITVLGGIERTGGGELPVLEYQLGFGLDPVNAQMFHSGQQISVTNLQAGKMYYFWARARNDLGWSAWSQRRDVLLPAGAFVKVSGDWKRALPWIKVGGLWKLATPLTKTNDIWKRTY